MIDPIRESPCPYINKAVLTDEFTRPISYKCQDGSEYVFYDHDDGYGETTRVQYCQLVGRKRDIFECLNVSEWTSCSHYRSAQMKEFKQEGEQDES